MNKRVVSSTLITGATGGIGGALAEAYAAPGAELVLQGRNEAALEELAARCAGHGARVRTKILDIRDRRALRAWGRELGERSPIDLAIVNAGVSANIGRDGEGERWEAIEELVDVNVLGALATVDAVLPAMRARRRGQIALVSSLAAWYGMPIAPSYCASKAALKAYGEALRGWLAPEGVGVTVVMPGFVESPMQRAFPGPSPFLWSAKRAARVIKRRLERDPARITFPFPLDLGSWILAVLPAAVSQRLVALMGYGR